MKEIALQGGARRSASRYRSHKLRNGVRVAVLDVPTCRTCRITGRIADDWTMLRDLCVRDHTRCTSNRTPPVRNLLLCTAWLLHPPHSYPTHLGHPTNASGGFQRANRNENRSGRPGSSSPLSSSMTRVISYTYEVPKPILQCTA